MTTIQTAPEMPRTSRGASGLDPVWMLNVQDDRQLVRRITVFAPSSDAAFLKGREQLDDGETLSFCFTDPASEHLGLPPASGVFQPR